MVIKYLWPQIFSRSGMLVCLSSVAAAYRSTMEHFPRTSLSSLTNRYRPFSTTQHILLQYLWSKICFWNTSSGQAFELLQNIISIPFYQGHTHEVQTEKRKLRKSITSVQCNTTVNLFVVICVTKIVLRELHSYLKLFLGAKKPYVSKSVSL